MLKKIFNISFLLIFFTFAFISIVILKNDMWDGVIIEYASVIKKYDGIKSYFYESTWFLQYQLSLIIIKLSEIIKISYKNMNAIAVMFLMLLLLREVKLLLINKIKVSNNTAYFAILLVLTFSAWSVLLSSIMTFHLMCILLGFYSVRHIHQKNYYFGFFFLIISYSLKSNLVFLPVLSYLYDFINNKYNSLFKCISKKTLAIFLLGIIFYSIVQFLIPPSGRYINYHKLLTTELYDLRSVFHTVIKMCSYISIPFWLLTSLYLVFFTFNKYKKLPNSIINLKNFKLIFVLLLLFVSGFFPYLMVGNYLHLLDFYEWNERNAILLAIPIALFSAVTLNILYKNQKIIFMRKLIIISGVVLIIINILILTVSVSWKLNQQIFINDLHNHFRYKKIIIPPGNLYICLNPISGPSIRNYEFNFFMFKQYGKADWWVTVNSKEKKLVSIPYYIRNNKKYQLKYIYNYKNEHLNNHTVIKIEASNYNGAFNIIKNILNLNQNSIKTSLTVLNEEFSKKNNFANCK